MTPCFQYLCSQNCKNKACIIDQNIKKYQDSIKKGIVRGKRKMKLNINAAVFFDDFELFCIGFKAFVQKQLERFDLSQQQKISEINAMVNIQSVVLSRYPKIRKNADIQWLIYFLADLKEMEITPKNIKKLKDNLVRHPILNRHGRELKSDFIKQLQAILNRFTLNKLIIIAPPLNAKIMGDYAKRYTVRLLGVKKLFINQGRVIKDTFDDKILQMIANEINHYQHFSVSKRHFKAENCQKAFVLKSMGHLSEQALIAAWRKIKNKKSSTSNNRVLADFNNHERHFRQDLETFLYPQTHHLNWLITAIKAPISGVVCDVNIQKNQMIKTTDTALKITKNIVKSDHNGQIIDIFCKENNQVNKNYLLFKVNALKDKFKSLSALDLDKILLKITHSDLLKCLNDDYIMYKIS